MFRNSKFTIKYLNDLIEIERKCNKWDWDHSEQSLANIYLKSINFSYTMSLSNTIFMDGLNFFNQVNYLYNRSSNYLKLIGFHNDFTFGITSKTYRIRELGVYELDDNEYYSSRNNKYLYYIKEININSTNQLSKILSTLVYICKILNRILIFPRFPCGKNKCTFVRMFNLEYFERMCGVNYRENSFLNSNNIPSYLVKRKKLIKEIEKEDDIRNLSKIENHLIIINEIYFTNLQYVNCFRDDDYWQKKCN